MKFSADVIYLVDPRKPCFMAMNPVLSESNQLPEPNSKLWKYMDLAKYLSLLTSQTLWLSKADQSEDPFEGSATQPTKENMKKNVARNFSDPISRDIPEAVLDVDAKFNIHTKYHSYLNSWHLSEHESAAMWELYRKDFGIAIVSSGNHLDQSLDFHAYPQNVISPAILKINYIDYEVDQIPFENGMNGLLQKRKSFEHEKEVRILLVTDLDDDGNLDMEKPLPPQLDSLTQIGIPIPVMGEFMISEVRIDPTAPLWFVNTVEEVTKS